MTPSVSQTGTESPPCTICRGYDVESFDWGAYHLNLAPPLGVVRCRKCNVLFLSPRPSEPMRIELMNGSVPQPLLPYSRKTANYGAVTQGRSEMFKLRLEKLEQLVETSRKNRIRLLDIGASSGALIGIARARGWDAYGLEPSLDGAMQAYTEGIQMPRGLAEKLPYRSEEFDLAHSHHVFEHLADPLIAAKEALRVLRPGGLIFLEVPNQLENVMFRRDIILRRVPQRERTIRSIHHLWFFSRKTLPRLLSAAGFEEIEVEDDYSWSPRGLRAPLTLSTQFVGRFAYGGPLVRAYGRRPSKA